ncbi:hypothetical protein O6P43_012110 [Quillaja saponaria]|uniref:Uncharacterized protein n=1 Tax=Quillaja saponaria TaxID=32244 RepID=A0AAD7M0Z2_QUISA|nr:hypothetical protein O6P43_012110 [Quillaja saponaria]
MAKRNPLVAEPRRNIPMQLINLVQQGVLHLKNLMIPPRRLARSHNLIQGSVGVITFSLRGKTHLLYPETSEHLVGVRINQNLRRKMKIQNPMMSSERCS